MTTALAPHPCNPDPFAVCECGRPGQKTFGATPAPLTAAYIETTFEFVEDQADGVTFTEKDVVERCLPILAGSPRWVFPGAAVGKTLRIMEHHGMVERLGRSQVGKGRPIQWRRSAPVASNRGW